MYFSLIVCYFLRFRLQNLPKQPFSNTSANVPPITRKTKFYNRTKQEKSFIKQTGRQHILDRTAAGIPRIHLLFILRAYNFDLLGLFPNI
jgi:hypothetical protein